MKLFNLFFLTVSVLSTAFAAKDYQITWYGCPRHCDSQARSSCNLPTWPMHEGGTKYFCALSTHFPHFNDYCGKRVVVLLADGTKTMINVKVVDSCSSCPPYHVDLSHTSFGDLLPHTKGEADCVWSVYDNDGTRLAGPIYKSLSKASSALGMSSDAILSAFDSTAKKMVRNGDYVGKLGSSSGNSGSEQKVVTTTRKTTTKKTTTTTTKKVTTKLVISIVNKAPTQKTVVPSSLPSKQAPSSNTSVPAKNTPVVNQSLPAKNTQVNQYNPAATSAIPANPANPANPVATPSTSGPVINPVVPANPQANNTLPTPVTSATPKSTETAAAREADEGGSSTPVVAAALVGCVGAAGLGFIFLKKRKNRSYSSY